MIEKHRGKPHKQLPYPTPKNVDMMICDGIWILWHWVDQWMRPRRGIGGLDGAIGDGKKLDSGVMLIHFF